MTCRIAQELEYVGLNCPPPNTEIEEFCPKGVSDFCPVLGIGLKNAKELKEETIANQGVQRVDQFYKKLEARQKALLASIRQTITQMSVENQ